MMLLFIVLGSLWVISDDHEYGYDYDYYNDYHSGDDDDHHDDDDDNNDDDDNYDYGLQGFRRHIIISSFP